MAENQNAVMECRLNGKSRECAALNPPNPTVEVARGFWKAGVVLLLGEVSQQGTSYLRAGILPEMSPSRKLPIRGAKALNQGTAGDSNG